MKLYLVSGRTGAGKTTLARRMASLIPAYRISHDEMLAVLYGPRIDQTQFRELCERVNQLIWREVAQLSELGVSVVMEGFGSRPLRDLARTEASRLGIEHEFLYVDCPQDLRWRRVEERNQDPRYIGAFISEEDFGRMETIKEEFDADEKVRVVDNSGHDDCLDISR